MGDARDPLRAQLVRLLDWEEAHVSLDTAAVDGIPTSSRGAQAQGFEHSPWQLLEHMRMAQKDILGFSVNPTYVHELTWPDDYWQRMWRRRTRWPGTTALPTSRPIARS